MRWFAWLSFIAAVLFWSHPFYAPALGRGLSGLTLKASNGPELPVLIHAPVQERTPPRMGRDPEETS